MKTHRSKFLGKLSLLLGRFRPKAPVYLGDNTLLLYTDYGFYIFLDGQDDSLTPHILISGVWERGVARYIAANLKLGDVFVDVGANNGFHALLAAKQVGPGGLVVAYEPQARLCALMQRSANANLIMSRFLIEHQAIGDETGRMSLGKFPNFAGSATFTANDLVTSYEDVEMDRLAASLAAVSQRIGKPVTPTMIKVDAEGYEYEVWRGMRDMIQALPHIKIVLEFSPVSYRNRGADPLAFLREFSESGLRVQMLDKAGRLKDVRAPQSSAMAASGAQFDLVLSK